MVLDERAHANFESYVSGCKWGKQSRTKEQKDKAVIKNSIRIPIEKRQYHDGKLPWEMIFLN